MQTLEVFFDYTCPFCMRGHEQLKALIGAYPNIEIKWCPCEAHPEPEPGPHSDLVMMGALAAIDLGIDMIAFGDAMYAAMLSGRVNRRDISGISDAAAPFVEQAVFESALKSGKYKGALNAMNDYAYEARGVWAIPSYRMGARKLDAREGVGVTGEQLKAFLDGGSEDGQGE